MKRYILFAREWRGVTERFPCEEFDHVFDERALQDSMDTCGQEWARAHPQEWSLQLGRAEEQEAQFEREQEALGEDRVDWLRRLTPIENAGRASGWFVDAERPILRDQRLDSGTTEAESSFPELPRAVHGEPAFVEPPKFMVTIQENVSRWSPRLPVLLVTVDRLGAGLAAACALNDPFWRPSVAMPERLRVGVADSHDWDVRSRITRFKEVERGLPLVSEDMPPYFREIVNRLHALKSNAKDVLDRLSDEEDAALIASISSTTRRAWSRWSPPFVRREIQLDSDREFPVAGEQSVGGEDRVPVACRCSSFRAALSKAARQRAKWGVHWAHLLHDHQLEKFRSEDGLTVTQCNQAFEQLYPAVEFDKYRRLIDEARQFILNEVADQLHGKAMTGGNPRRLAGQAKANLLAEYAAGEKQIPARPKAKRG